MTIVLTAGHSHLDPGAVNGLAREADIAVDMRNIINHILRADYGLTVKTDGLNRTNLPLKEAIKLIRGSAIAIEFHCNAATNKQATGIEALTIAKNKTAAQALCQSVANITGWQLRGDKGYKSDNAGQHSRLAYAQAGGIIFEPFFISNDEDLAIWYAKKWLICRAIAAAIVDLVSVRG